MVAPSSGSSSLKKYLKRYENNEEEEEKKKKKKMKTKLDMNSVLVVDEDPVWQSPVQHEEEDDESQDEEKPQVDEDIEVKRMKRLEQLKSWRPFGAISEDGSGWVPVSDTAKHSDISPPRRRRAWNDTPEPESESEHISEVNSDMSPPCKQRAQNDTPEPKSDLSPPRKGRSRKKPIKESKRPKTSFVSGKDIKEEIARTNMDDWLRFQKMDPSISGRNAEGVRHDKRTVLKFQKASVIMVKEGPCCHCEIEGKHPWIILDADYMFHYVLAYHISESYKLEGTYWNLASRCRKYDEYLRSIFNFSKCVQFDVYLFDIFLTENENTEEDEPQIDTEMINGIIKALQAIPDAILSTTIMIL
uniref:Uncharacterized protein n=1 Tax=Lactuca sativa TaxID=4236 RepID=A0A9R1W8V7_LACSA|nr:hypothetical protein LSAT_V11C300102340 [Lactuca sativa]